MARKSKIRPLSDWPVTIKNVFLIAGPCSAESEEQLMDTARALAKAEVSAIRTGIWKPRTRPGSFEGIGVRALKWLKQAGRAVGLPVAVEAANAEHVEDCLKHEIDILWVGARTTSNPFAVQALADALKGVDVPVMVKNPMSPDLELWVGAIERLQRAGVRRLAAIHRGFSTSKSRFFRNSPLWRIPIELRRRIPEIPMLCDPSHICGKRATIFSIAQEALDLLFEGLMIEVHPNPAAALSDKDQQLTPRAYMTLIRNLKVKRLSSEDVDFQERLGMLRAEVDAVDRDLIELLAKRMEIVRAMSVAKRELRISSFQPDRWEQILKTRLEEARKRGLSRECAFGIFECIHEEAIRQQAESGEGGSE